MLKPAPLWSASCYSFMFMALFVNSRPLFTILSNVISMMRRGLSNFSTQSSWLAMNSVVSPEGCRLAANAFCGWSGPKADRTVAERVRRRKKKEEFT